MFPSMVTASPQEKKADLTLSTHTSYKITSERGQPLYKGQNAGSRACLLFRGFTIKLIRIWLGSKIGEREKDYNIVQLDCYPVILG